MLRNLTALSTALVLFIAPAAQAVPMGIQDDGQSSIVVAENTAAVGGTWTRTTVYIGQHGVAKRIRDAHKAGLKIILTVGGTGTRTRHPSFTKALRYIKTLPAADRYTIHNEPDLGPHGNYAVAACEYRRGWLKARRSLHKRLLFGDLSAHRPLSFTQAVANCGWMPKHLDVALHPYQSTDPLDHDYDEQIAQGALGNLGYAKRWLKRNAGIQVTWWLTEFGYVAGVVPDARAAWLWPRALKQATRHKARVLIAYTAQGPTWDTRPRALAWCSMTRRRACPGARRPDDHRTSLGFDPVMKYILEYASAQL